MPACKNLIGQVFNRLTVIEKTSIRKHGFVFWLCKCEYGNTHLASTNSLKRGNIKSCGCLKQEQSVITNTKHNLSRHKLYKNWHGMMRRCYNKKTPEYKYYGARGVYVCKRWHDIKNFIEDMESSYKEGLTLDKDSIKKGNLCYCKEYCCWANYDIQNNNMRSNVLFELNGTTKSISQWGRVVKVPFGTFRSRLRHGWSLEEALHLPKDTHVNTHRRETNEKIK